jgi:hypothetical protein
MWENITIMIKTFSAIIIISMPSIQDYNQEYIYLEGDYTECAIEYMEKNKPEKPFDINTILYNQIGKELEEEESRQK